jgi:hypothetical protein
MDDNLALAGGNVRRKGRISFVLTLSYVFDWVVLAVFAAVGAVLGNLTPNKRPFSLYDPNIAFVDIPVPAASRSAVRDRYANGSPVFRSLSKSMERDPRLPDAEIHG